MPAFIERQHSSRLGAAQTVVISTASAASTVFDTQTRQIRVVCQLTAGTDVHIRIGDGTPTAVLTDSLLPVNLTEYFTVTPGQKIAVIGGAAAAGTLYVTEMQ
jgi:hypothetical protein